MGRLFNVKLPWDLIKVRTEYRKGFVKFIENVLDVPISFLYMFVKKTKSKFSIEITMYMTDSEIIRYLKEKKDQDKLLFKDYPDFFNNDPDLFLELTILKNDPELFELNKNKVYICYRGHEESVMPYFCKIIELYFKEFVQKTTLEVVNLTKSMYPISEKEFLPSVQPK